MGKSETEDIESEENNNLYLKLKSVRNMILLLTAANSFLKWQVVPQGTKCLYSKPEIFPLCHIPSSQARTMGGALRPQMIKIENCQKLDFTFNSCKFLSKVVALQVVPQGPKCLYSKPEIFCRAPYSLVPSQDHRWFLGAPND